MSRLNKWCLPVTLAVTLAACGGSSDGGGGGGIGSTYSGKTNPALINDGNAQQLAVTTYSGPRTNGAIFNGSKTPIEAASMTAATSGRGTGLQGAVDMMDTALSALPPSYHPTTTGGGSVMTAASSDREMMQGSCGGTATYTGAADEQTGRFNLSFTFDDYCNDNTVLNGSMRISGSQSEQSTKMTLTFDSLQSKTHGQRDTTIGTIVVSVQGPVADMIMNLVMQSEADGEMVWLENLSFQETESMNGSLSYSELTMQGRIYRSQDGYVDITTPVPFRVDEYSYYPSSGRVEIIGADRTSATLTATEGGSYRVDADTSGNGEIDYSETFSWQDEL